MERNEVLEKAKYIARVDRDEALLKLFVKFSNRVKHPRATLFMVSVGLMLIALPIANKEIALAGQIICFVMGPLLAVMGLFRHQIGVNMLKNNPETKLGEELTYIFGNTDIKISKEGQVEKFGSYANVYRLWESEKIFYIGINEDDLVVLPKVDFEEGDVSTFREFLLGKSGCIFTWQPNRIDNIIKNYFTTMKWNMQKRAETFQKKEKKEK